MLRYECALRLIELELWHGRATAALPEAFSALAAVCRTDASPFAGPLFVLALRACADAADHARATGDAAELYSAVEGAARLSELRVAATVDPFAGRRTPGDRTGGFLVVAGRGEPAPRRVRHAAVGSERPRRGMTYGGRIGRPMRGGGTRRRYLIVRTHARPPRGAAERGRASRSTRAAVERNRRSRSSRPNRGDPADSVAQSDEPLPALPFRLDRARAGRSAAAGAGQVQLVKSGQSCSSAGRPPACT